MRGTATAQRLRESQAACACGSVGPWTAIPLRSLSASTCSARKVAPHTQPVLSSQEEELRNPLSDALFGHAGNEHVPPGLFSVDRLRPNDAAVYADARRRIEERRTLGAPIDTLGVPRS
jgi:hypothetical protein